MHRREVKRNHERAIIEAFLSYCNDNCGTDFSILQQPDPPDAIVGSGTLRKWVEHCDAYRSAVEARTDYEIAFSRSGMISEPDTKMAYAVIDVIRKKLVNKSYGKAYLRFGGGILLLIPV